MGLNGEAVLNRTKDFIQVFGGWFGRHGGNNENTTC